MAELVQKLKPYVTVFSAALPLQCKHGDQVLVGGRVTSVLNIAELFEGTSEKRYAEEEGVYITLDDSIGEIEVCLHQRAYAIYLKNHGPMNVGDVILAEGRVAVVDTTHAYEGPRGKRILTDAHKDETKRVLSYQAAPLPEDKPKKVKAVE